MYFYIPSTRGNQYTDTYLFIPSKCELPANATGICTTNVLEEFTIVMKSKQNRNIQFTNKSINSAIGVLSNLLKLTVQAVPSTATCPKVD